MRADVADVMKYTKTVVQKMKDTTQKSRVTFCYRLAEATGTLGKLA